MALLPNKLIADRLELRAFSLTYFEDAFEAVKESLPEVQRWLWWAQEPLDESSYRDFVRIQSENFANDVEWRYFIFDRSAGNLVGGGSIDLMKSGVRRSANIGYWIRTSCVGRNFATRTAQILTDAAFSFLPEISSVEIDMDVANIASARIPEKLGYAFMGEVDKAVRAPGHTGRGFVWTMIRSDWRGSEFTSTEKR
ncbi:MAG TPA: GNAT family N-acetyltransferase [Acidimicrobiales bacterium]